MTANSEGAPRESNFELTREFHRAIGQLPEDYSGENTNTERYVQMVELRERLIGEEASEACDALHAYAQGRGSLTDVAGELADVLCVTYGAAAALGIPMDEVYRQFHASNMTKVGGPVRPDGKVLKGSDYRPPDLASLPFPGGGVIPGGHGDVPPRYTGDDAICHHGKDKATCGKCEGWRNEYASGFDAAH